MTNSRPTKTLLGNFKKLTRKRHFFLYIVEEGHAVETHGMYWSGGSYSKYYPVDLQCNSVPPHPLDEAGGGFPSFKAGKMHVETGRVVVQTGTSCGKPDTLRIYVTKNDAEKVALIEESV